MIFRLPERQTHMVSDGIDAVKMQLSIELEFHANHGHTEAAV